LGPPVTDRVAEFLLDKALRMIGQAVDAGLGYDTVSAGLFGDENDIKQLASELVSRLLSPHGKSEWRGSALVTYLICGMLLSCLGRGVPPPASLVVAYIEQFRVIDIGRPGKGHKIGGFERAVNYYHEHPGASVAQIAKAVGVDRRTIRRWNAAGALASGIFLPRRTKPKTTD
jgi:hypothetical protein